MRNTLSITTLNMRTGTFLQKPKRYTTKPPMSSKGMTQPPINGIPERMMLSNTPNLIPLGERCR